MHFKAEEICVFLLVKFSKTINIFLTLLCLLSFLGASLNKCSLFKDSCEVIEKFHSNECGESKHSDGCEFCFDCVCKGGFHNNFEFTSGVNLPFKTLEFHSEYISLKNFSNPIERPPQNLI